ncbi:protein of unknown function [Caballeronia arationis]|jgi:hypothetical protein|uniref:Uncharacterized protein n=1 Tax=Caballeronia arationis TaxID=1777142 RepID=A0A7Z7I6L4_9BURK|nr:DUF4410 domain-containing protein [Caballeronia arationis]SOE61154.1 protein of unknown function [Caballeronia arationis]
MFASIGSFGIAGRKGVRMASAAIAFSSMMLAGCAGTGATAAQYSAAPAARPDNIYVYAFDSAAGEVKLDSGIMQKMKARVEGKSAADEQSVDAAEVREDVANEIVKQLQSMGLHAVRSDAPAPAGENVLLVTGHFDDIDAGSRRRRTLVGLGAGKSEVSTSVQILYKPAGGGAQLVQSFDASADSGKMPGVAETAGVGAVAGHAAVSAAAGAGLHGATEAKRDSVSADAKHLGDSIAKQIAEVGVAQGWMSTSRVKG